MDPILQASGLGVRFNDATIFSDLNFSLNDRDVLVILGPNGSGKTVLLKVLVGVLPHQGRVQWRTSVKIGYVPQRIPLSRELPMTIEEFFALKGTSPSSAFQLLEHVGFSEKEILKKQMGFVSSGQFQKVLIAWALASQPDILLFDEPMEGIDFRGGECIYEYFDTLRRERGLTIVLVTHDLSAAYRDASHVLWMGKGMNRFGPRDEMFSSEALHEIYGSNFKYLPNFRDHR
jgi:zinc transport system ATP-binding protein